jgi:pyruvate, water dikinase
MGLLWLGEPACADVRSAGGKGASLSRMVAAGLPVPPGFVVGADGFARVIGAGPVGSKAAALLDAVNVEDAASLARTSRSVRELIQSVALPDELVGAVSEAYARLGGPVAVRSSGVAEDSVAASYAGQQETHLNVLGADQVIARIRDCWASFFSAHAVFYRKRKGSLADLGIAVVVQKLIVPDKAGVTFTIDPIQRRRDRLVIEAVRGFGEALVSGAVTPDNYQVARADARLLGAFVPPGSGADARVLDGDEIRRLVMLGLQLEDFFGGPQDVEWAIADGTIYLLQSRPVTTAGLAEGRGR